MENYEQEYKQQIAKHNKRVRSIRNTRLSRADVKCIDDMISKGFQIQDTLTESVMWGSNFLTMEDVMEFTEALRNFNSQFTERKK